MSKILLVDDQPAVLSALSILFGLNGYACALAKNPREALAVLEIDDIGLVITDMNFRRDTTSGEEGKTLFYEIRKLQPDLPIILLTGWAQISTAVELVKAGAADYLAKPWDDHKLLTCVKNLLELAEVNRQQQSVQFGRRQERDTLARQFDLAGVVYQSEIMQQLLNTALRVSKADVPILITGPNGAGKEKIAEIIQRNSTVKNGPFIRVNAGAIPLELIEAELFGADPGAYTGAKQTRIGYFEMADGGTLFLDEIGNLPLSGQMKLLRVLQTGEFQRLGSSLVRKASVRLISATNSDIPLAIAGGQFREDLYYRINVIELTLPPLVARKEDIVPLARYFLAGHAISPEALRVLESHTWPGNVRELQNAILRAKLLAQKPMIVAQDFILPPIKTKARLLFEPNEQELRDALLLTSSIAEAARSLGLSRQALYRRLQKYGIEIANNGEEI